MLCSAAQESSMTVMTLARKSKRMMSGLSHREVSGRGECVVQQIRHLAPSTTDSTSPDAHGRTGVKSKL
jgi:hypothetical protein